MTVQQGGIVTPGHVASWTTDGIIRDGGTATDGQVNALGMYGDGGTPFGIVNRGYAGPYTGAYTVLGLGISQTAAELSVVGTQGIGFRITVNGTVQASFGPGGTFTLPLPVTSGGTGNSAVPTDGQLLIGNGTGYTLNTLTAGPNISIGNTAGTITISSVGSGGTLPVASGGTGATTLTGYVQGNGTAPLTAVAAIPNTDVSGLGTLSTQNANAISVTGGSMSGVAISLSSVTGGTVSGLSAPIAVTDGGTGATTLTANGLVVGNGASALSTLAPGTKGNVATSTGTAWSSSAVPLGLGNPTQAWKDVSGSRSLGVVYTNTTGAAISGAVTVFSNGNPQVEVFVNSLGGQAFGLTVSSGSFTVVTTVYYVAQAGETYEVTYGGAAPTVQFWGEMTA